MLLLLTAAFANLRCEDRCDALAYRDGLCSDCNCCPKCWSCVELRAYGCAESNGLRIEEKVLDHGSVRTGDKISWLLNSSAWHRGCPSLPTLPPGLILTDAGDILGTIGYNRKERSHYAVEFTAFDADDFDAGVLRRLLLRFDVDNARSAVLESSQASAEPEAEAAALRAVRRSFAIYDEWTRQERSHQRTIEGMKAELVGLREILGVHPKLAGGEYWMYLGGLHMNIVAGRHSNLCLCLCLCLSLHLHLCACLRAAR